MPSRIKLNGLKGDYSAKESHCYYHHYYYYCYPENHGNKVQEFSCRKCSIFGFISWSDFVCVCMFVFFILLYDCFCWLKSFKKIFFSRQEDDSPLCVSSRDTLSLNECVLVSIIQPFVLLIPFPFYIWNRFALSLIQILPQMGHLTEKAQ